MGKYLKLFENHTDYEEYINSSTAVLPNVSYCINEDKVYYLPFVGPITIVYKGDNASATNIMVKNIDAFDGDTYTLDEASITKMILDDNKVTLSDFNVANLGQYGETYDVYTYTFNDENEHTLKVWTNSSDMFRFSPWNGGGPSPSQSAYFSSIKSVVIPNTITTISRNAFNYCTSLTSVTIGNNVTSIGNGAFRGCTSLTSIEIPSGVTSIGDDVFQYCTSLTSIDIPNSVTSIGSSAFYDCSGMTSVTIGSGVTSIGQNAFHSCTSLTSITIPNSVTSIDTEAFRYCSGLTSIVCNATTAPTIQSDTFRDVKTNGTLTVPANSTGYDVWMGTGNYYLGKYNWTKVEQ